MPEPASRTRAAAVVSPASACTSRRTAATTGAARSASQYFSGRGIGSIQVKPGDSKTIFVGSGAQGSRGISSTCCTGVDRGANIPGAPHFGLWRSTDGGETFSLVNQGNTTNCTTNTPTEVFLGTDGVLAARRSAGALRPERPEHRLRDLQAKGIWRSYANGDPGTWVQIFAPRGPSTSPATGADVERAEFDVVALPGGVTTRMYVGVGSGAGQTAKFFRSDKRTQPCRRRPSRN